MTTFDINLIATRRRQKQRALRMMRAAFYSLLGLVVLVVIVYLQMLVTTQRVEGEIAAIQGELSEPAMVTKVERINFLERKTTELKPRVQLLEKVHSSEAEWIHILRDISACIPQEVWLGQMNTKRSEKQQTIALKGKALRQAEIGAFMLSLNQPSWSNTSALTYAQASGDSRGSRFYEFEITIPLKTIIGSNLK